VVCKRTQRQNSPQRNTRGRTPVSPVPVSPLPVVRVPAGRATWCGQIRLGETRFPVKAFAANVASPGGPLCQVHAGCGRKIQQRKHCPVHGELTAAEIGKAYPYGPDRLIPLTAAELASLAAADDKTISITRFVTACEFDLCLLAGRSLFLLPENSVAHPDYGAVALAMELSDAWGIGEVVFSGRRRLVALESRLGRLVLHLLHWPAQRRCCPVLDAPFDARPAAPPKQRVTAIGRHITDNSGAIAWGELNDDWDQRLTALVQKKLAPRNGVKPKALKRTRKSPRPKPKMKSKPAASKSTA
jgi:Ku protein